MSAVYPPSPTTASKLAPPLPDNPVFEEDDDVEPSKFSPGTKHVELDSVGELPTLQYDQPIPSTPRERRRSSIRPRASSQHQAGKALPHLAFAVPSPRPRSQSRGAVIGKVGKKLPSALRWLKQGNPKPRGLREPPASRKLAVMVAMLQFVLMMGGWNDGASGPLIPKLQQWYHIDFAIMSLIWVINFLGCLLSSFFVGSLSDRFGLTNVCALGLVIQSVAFCILGAAPPYPVFVAGYFISGAGNALYVSLVNSILAKLPAPGTKVALGHAAYGIGAAIAPLVATQFVLHSPRVNTYYFTAFGIAILLAILMLALFRGRTAEEIIPLDHQRAIEEEEVRRGLTAVSTPATSAAPSRRPSFTDENGVDTIELGEITAARRESMPAQGLIPIMPPADTTTVKVSDVVRLRLVQLMALYLFIYVGAEVALGGWIVTFMLDERNAPESIGYMSSGYFGGLGLGRIVLIPVTAKLGAKWAIYLYTFICIACMIILWTVKDLYVGIAAVALCGMSFGPIVPICINTITDALPRRIQTVSIAFASSISAGGSALVPFVIGILAQSFTIKVLPAFLTALLGASVINWWLISRIAF